MAGTPVKDFAIIGEVLTDSSAINNNMVIL